MHDLTEMLKSQADALAKAYRAGLEEGRLQGYREGKADGIEEARTLVERSFPDFKLPVHA